MSPDAFLYEVAKYLHSPSNIEGAAQMLMECRGRVYLFGNGASASIAAHTAVDLTKMCGIPAMTFHDPNLMTCFVNDYGGDFWMRECVKAFVTSEDLVILISSSGASKNIIYTADACDFLNIPLITLTGFHGNNPVRNRGMINMWVNNFEYNVVESVHWCWMAAIIEYIREKKNA